MGSPKNGIDKPGISSNNYEPAPILLPTLSSGITVNNPEVDRVGHRSGKRLKRRFIHLCGVNPGAVFQQFLRKTQLLKPRPSGPNKRHLLGLRG